MKIIKILIIASLFFQISCGYKVVNNSENYNFEVINHELKGDKKVNNILERNFKRFKQNKNASKYFSIITRSELNKSVASKNTSGDISNYKMNITVVLVIKENDEILNEITYRRDTNYNNLTSKFDLKQYENILVQDLVEQISSQITQDLISTK